LLLRDPSFEDHESNSSLHLSIIRKDFESFE
jgi:ankyrin repeat protein